MLRERVKYVAGDRETYQRRIGVEVKLFNFLFFLVTS